MPSPLGGDVFLAESSGYEGVKNAVVLRTEDGLTVDVQDYRNKRLYKVISTAAGVKVEEIEPKSGRCGCDALAPQNPVRSASANGSANGLASTPGTSVDILVAYDRGASEWVEDESSNAMVAAYVLRLRDTLRPFDCATVILHHQPKGGAKDKLCFAGAGASSLQRYVQSICRIRDDGKGAFWFEAICREFDEPFKPVMVRRK